MATEVVDVVRNLLSQQQDLWNFFYIIWHSEIILIETIVETLETLRDAEVLYIFFRSDVFFGHDFNPKNLWVYCWLLRGVDS